MVKRIMPLLIVLVTLCGLFVVPASASTLVTNKEYETTVETELHGFIPDGYKYYFCHQWENNDAYYIGFYKSAPVMDKTIYDWSGHQYYKLSESDGSNPLYYRFRTYDDMIAYLVLNDASDAGYVYEVNHIEAMFVNLSNERTLYSNFDLNFTDGDVYYAKNAYTVTENVIVKDEKPYLVDEFTSDFISAGLSAEFIGILPVVVSFIVLYIALHKGIRFLFNFIRSA